MSVAVLRSGRVRRRDSRLRVPVVEDAACVLRHLCFSSADVGSVPISLRPSGSRVGAHLNENGPLWWLWLMLTAPRPWF